MGSTGISRSWPAGRGGLAVKLLLLQLLWMLPALGLADYYVLRVETRRLESGLAEGRLDAVGAAMAVGLENHPADPDILALALDRERLLLERARGGLAEGAGHILVELSDQPLQLTLTDQNGRRLARSGPADAQAPTAGWLVHESTTPIRLRDGTAAVLSLKLAVPRPGLSVLAPRSFEGSMLVLTALLLAVSGGVLLSLYLGRRLGRIRRQVMAWRRGELSGRIHGGHSDELGVLAADLDAMAADLDQLLHDRASLAALEERQRVARDLHDTVKQKAFALGLQLAALRRSGGQSTAALGEAERLCSEIRDELAEVVTTLHPQPRRIENFRQRLADRARRWQQATGLALKMSCEAGEEPVASVSEQLLRILDEALANVARHAGPCRATVTLRRSYDHQWILEIADDGRGFDLALVPGRGLVHLRERAEAVAGELRLQSTVGRGTRVAVKLAFTPNDIEAVPTSARWSPT
ncbi:MAG: hypothetical protein KDI48_04525 [Xanthomonadales bacterium]|nr:hypothetical protein [Xanthomonadales bacterium]